MGAAEVGYSETAVLIGLTFGLLNGCMVKYVQDSAKSNHALAPWLVIANSRHVDARAIYYTPCTVAPYFCPLYSVRTGYLLPRWPSVQD